MALSVLFSPSPLQGEGRGGGLCRGLRMRNAGQYVLRRPIRRRERVDDPDLAEDLAMLQILGEQRRARAGLRRRDNERIPPRKRMSLLQQPASFQDREIDDHRPPCRKVARDSLAPPRRRTPASACA